VWIPVKSSKVFNRLDSKEQVESIYKEETWWLCVLKHNHQATALLLVKTPERAFTCLNQYTNNNHYHLRRQVLFSIIIIIFW